jgi:NAD(P)-dependent dehydrogenase (short-subunit alcohol dehydrogenase family)
VFGDRRELAITQEADDLILEAGRVDMLIANPDEFVPAVERDDAEMQRMIEGIFYPLRRLCRAVLSQMLACLKGRKGGVALYGAARGAQQTYIRYVALEVAPYAEINASAQNFVDSLNWPHDYR